jgi:hypothetical protein
MINKAEVQGFVCQRKGQDVNWVVFAKGTIHDQLRRIQSLEGSKSGRTSEGGKFGGGRFDTLSDYEGVDLDGENEEDIQTNAMA